VFFTKKDVDERETVQSGVVDLTLIGVNREIFNLPKTELRFNIIQKDVRPPEITDIQIINVTQTSVDFKFVCSDIATAYYIIAYNRTEAPTWEELKSQGPPEFETTNTQYGITFVGNELEGYGSFHGLSAETEYVIYVFLEDRGGNQIEANGYLEFKTLGNYFP
jgi:hypothetical protein